MLGESICIMLNKSKIFYEHFLIMQFQWYVPCTYNPTCSHNALLSVWHETSYIRRHDT